MTAISRRAILGLGAAAVVAPGLTLLPVANAAPASTSSPAATPSASAAPSGPATAITVNAASIARTNVNGLTFKGFGVLSANSTSALLMDYKALRPRAYEELLRILFGGTHPIMNMVKIEMGNDRNTSTGPEPATMRTASEEADVAREPGFQLAADALKYNPALQISILRWRSPAWADTNDRVYVWFKNTILAAYRRYGYMVGSVNPGFNETTPDLTWTKRFADLVHNDTTGYVSDDASLAGFRAGESDLFHRIKVIISDESGLGSFGDDMIADESLRTAVDVAGYHYTTDDTKAHDFTHLAEQYDKEVWNSEAQATFSNSAFRPHNNTADPTVPGTGIGGINGPLEMANTLVKGFVNSRRTHFIYQPAIGSFYEGGQYSYKELLSARDPWSGWIHYDVGLAVLQHFSSFSVTGWENASNTAGVALHPGGLRLHRHRHQSRQRSQRAAELCDAGGTRRLGLLHGHRQRLREDARLLADAERIHRTPRLAARGVADEGRRGRGAVQRPLQAPHRHPVAGRLRDLPGVGRPVLHHDADHPRRPPRLGVGRSPAGGGHPDDPSVGSAPRRPVE